MSGGRCTLPATRGKFCKRHSRCNQSVLQVLKQLKKERNKGKYRVLTGKKKEIVQKFLRKSVRIPATKETRFFDKSRNFVSNGYTRIVVGDHGAYFEFSKDQINLRGTKTKKGQEWRERNNSPYVKYKWKESPNGTKIYEQTKTVRYADYKPGFFYVDPNDLCY